MAQDMSHTTGTTGSARAGGFSGTRALRGTLNAALARGRAATLPRMPTQGDRTVKQIVGACNMTGPYVKTIGWGKPSQREVIILCNRPCGHEGDHMFSSNREAQVCRWSVGGQKVRG